MKHNSFFFLVLILLNGCSYIDTMMDTPVIVKDIPLKSELEYFPLTLKVIQENKFTNKDLEKIQLYISNDIVLRKHSMKSKTIVNDGALVVNSNDIENEILIEAGTPCIVTRSAKNYIEVSFDNDIKLIFLYSNHKCNKHEGLFFLYAKKWNNSIGTIKLNSSEYLAVGSSKVSYLMFGKKSSNSNSKNTVLLKGKLLTQSR